MKPDESSSTSGKITPARGASPFHVKGIIYQGTQLFFEQNVRGGLAALYQEIRDDELRAFIQQKFLPSSWYDVMPVATLIRCEARAMRLPVPQYLVFRTRFQANKDIGTVYKFLLKLVSLEQVGLRIPRIISQIFDFGTTETRAVGEGHIELVMRGWPAVLVEWCTTAFEVYVETAMRLSGARDSSLRVSSHVPEGPREGVELVTLKMDIRFA